MLYPASHIYSQLMAAAASAPVDAARDYLAFTHGKITIHNGPMRLTLANYGERLLAFAEIVRKNWKLYGGGAKPAGMDAPKRPRAEWKQPMIKAWLYQLETKEHQNAMLAAEALSAQYFNGNGRAYCLAAPMPVNGLPDGMVTAVRDDGRWVLCDIVSGMAVQPRGYSTRGAAEEEGLTYWNSLAESTRSIALDKARDASPPDYAAARRRWCLEHSIDDPRAIEPAPIPVPEVYEIEAELCYA